MAVGIQTSRKRKKINEKLAIAPFDTSQFPLTPISKLNHFVYLFPISIQCIHTTLIPFPSFLLSFSFFQIFAFSHYQIVVFSGESRDEGNER